MLAEYEDIKKKIKEIPKWYDTNGVPRYDKFHPELSPNIYATEVVLMEISCQNCGERFMVEMNWSASFDGLRGITPLHKQIKKKSIHYGDPPSHIKTDHAGSTMNCDDLRIKEFWTREDSLDWKRVKKYEIQLA